MGKSRSTVPGPIPVGTTVKRVGQASDFDLVGRITVEISASGQGAREQKGRVDGGKLALPDAATRFDIQEMVEKAFVTGSVRFGTLRAFEQVTQSFPGDLGGEIPEQDTT